MSLSVWWNEGGRLERHVSQVLVKALSKCLLYYCFLCWGLLAQVYLYFLVVGTFIYSFAAFLKHSWVECSMWVLPFLGAGDVAAGGGITLKTWLDFGCSEPSKISPIVQAAVIPVIRSLGTLGGGRETTESLFPTRWKCSSELVRWVCETGIESIEDSKAEKVKRSTEASWQLLLGGMGPRLGSSDRWTLGEAFYKIHVSVFKSIFASVICLPISLIVRSSSPSVCPGQPSFLSAVCLFGCLLLCSFQSHPPTTHPRQVLQKQAPPLLISTPFLTPSAGQTNTRACHPASTFTHADSHFSSCAQNRLHFAMFGASAFCMGIHSMHCQI